MTVDKTTKTQRYPEIGVDLGLCACGAGEENRTSRIQPVKD